MQNKDASVQNSNSAQSNPTQEKYAVTYTISDPSNVFQESVTVFVKASSEEEAKKQVTKMAEKHAREYAVTTTTTKTLTPEDRGKYGVALATQAAYEGAKTYQQAVEKGEVQPKTAIVLNLPPTLEEKQEQMLKESGVQIRSSQQLTQTEKTYIASAAIEEAKKQDSGLATSISSTLHAAGSQFTAQSREYFKASEQKTRSPEERIGYWIAGTGSAVASGIYTGIGSLAHFTGSVLQPNYVETIKTPTGKEAVVIVDRSKLPTAERAIEKEYIKRSAYEGIQISKAGISIGPELPHQMLQLSGSLVGYGMLQKGYEFSKAVIPERQSVIITSSESKLVGETVSGKPVSVSHAEGIVSKGARSEEFLSRGMEMKMKTQPDTSAGFSQVFTTTGKTQPIGQLSAPSYVKESSIYRSVEIPIEKSTISYQPRIQDERVFKELVYRNLPRFTEKPMAIMSETPTTVITYDPAKMAAVRTNVEKMIVTEAFSKEGAASTGKFLVGKEGVVGQVVTKQPGLLGKATITDVYIPKESLLSVKEVPKAGNVLTDVAVKAENIISGNQQVLKQVTEQTTKQLTASVPKVSSTSVAVPMGPATTAIALTKTDTKQEVKPETKPVSVPVSTTSAPQVQIAVTKVTDLQKPEEKLPEMPKITVPERSAVSGGSVTVTKPVDKIVPPIDILIPEEKLNPPIIPDRKITLLSPPPLTPTIVALPPSIPKLPLPPVGSGGLVSGKGTIRAKVKKEKWSDLLTTTKKSIETQPKIPSPNVKISLGKRKR